MRSKRAASGRLLAVLALEHQLQDEDDVLPMRRLPQRTTAASSPAGQRRNRIAALAAAAAAAAAEVDAEGAPVGAPTWTSLRVFELYATSHSPLRQVQGGRSASAVTRYFSLA
jgi:hypothetical protein